MTTLEVGDDGMLHVPAELLPGAKPHATFVLDVIGDTATLRPEGSAKPLWETATPQELADAIQEWADMPRPPVSDVPLDSLSREHIC